MPNQHIQLPLKPFQVWSIDIYGPLPANQHFKNILTCMDNFSKFVIAIPLTNTKSGNIANQIIQEIILPHGIPQSIQSDRGSNLIFKAMKKVKQLLDIKSCTTAAYNPQANAFVERFHRKLQCK